MLFADDIVLCNTRRDHVERKVEEWRRSIEERGLKISRRKTEYLGCKEHQDAEIRLQGETVKGIDIGLLRWRRMENWMRKSPTQCRAGGRTGR